ncbi:hypothetical protein BANRA_03450 [Acinetobacter baumannii]|nr:hypothetical protein BANRA_03450 [Acinetobacter baumannii]
MFVTLLLSVTILFDAEVKRPSMFVTFEVKSVTADEVACKSVANFLLPVMLRT